MKRILIVMLAVGFSAAGSAMALTALQARESAKREVNDSSKDRLIEIFGPKSSNITPMEWHVLFYDPYAKQDGRLVKVANDGVTGIEQGYTQLDQLRLAAYKLEEIINPRMLKIDSDRVLSNLSRSSPLKHIKISSMEMRLKKPTKGDVPPLWYVKIFGHNPRTGKEVELGTARLSAATGQIFEMDINPKKLE